jgi:hypothetical protein
VSDQFPPPTGAPVEPVEPAAPTSGTPKAIVWAFIFSLAGFLILTALAAVAMVLTNWKRVKATGKGKGLAIAALVISGFWLAIMAYSLLSPSSNPANSTATEVAEVIEAEPEPQLIEPEAAPEPESTLVQDPLVTQAQYGDAWPFAVNEGTLRCFVIQSEGIDDQPAAVITLDGNNYALNGVAIQQGYTELTLESDVWLDNPETGAKVSIGPLVTEAVALCDIAPSE